MEKKKDRMKKNTPMFGISLLLRKIILAQVSSWRALKNAGKH